MAIRLTVLCDNSVVRPFPAVGEHGFACLVEAGGRRLLFDTGQGQGLLVNARALGVDLMGLDGVVLSHGHYDHAGGLPGLLHCCGPVDVYLHPAAFQPRSWLGPGSVRSIGIPWQKEALEALGARFLLVESATELFPGVLLTGSVARTTPFETGDAHLRLGLAPDQDAPRDEVPDDLSLVLTTGEGPVVLFGCAHAGLVNILRQVARLTGRPDIRLMLGGTHLGPATEDQFQATVAFLRQLEFGRLGLSHCTGLPRGAQLYQCFPEQVFFAGVGTEISL